MGQDETSSRVSAALDPTTELRISNARLGAEISLLKAILQGARTQADEIRVDLDRWAAQAERQALAGPTLSSTPARYRGWPLPQRFWAGWSRALAHLRERS